MPVRLKKLIGTFVLIGLVLVYALVAVTVASAWLATAGWVTHLLYFLFTGLFWVLPAMAVISWMNRPPKRERA